MSFTSSSSMSDSAQPLLEKLSHITLPCLILLAFSCPPFRGRGIIFATLIIANDYACTFSPWPPNAADSRPLRYGMATSWFFVLPALERLLLHVPERDFWLLDQEGLANNGHPEELTWDKVRWAARLTTTPRAVGWNFGDRRVNAARANIKEQRVGRLKFAAGKLARAALAYITLDTVLFVARKAPIPVFWAWNRDTIKQVAYVDLLMGLSSYTTMKMQFELAAMIAAVFFRGQPEDWPPLFGSISECYTISNVWGKFWHGYIRQPVLGVSHAIINALKLPRRSPEAYLVHLLTAFLISCFFHILALFVVCEGYIEPRSLVVNMGLFFMAQPVGAITESIVIKLYQDIRLSEQVPAAGRQRQALFRPKIPDDIPHNALRVIVVELRSDAGCDC